MCKALGLYSPGSIGMEAMEDRDGLDTDMALFDELSDSEFRRAVEEWESRETSSVPAEGQLPRYVVISPHLQPAPLTNTIEALELLSSSRARRRRTVPQKMTISRSPHSAWPRRSQLPLPHSSSRPATRLPRLKLDEAGRGAARTSARPLKVTVRRLRRSL